MTQHLRKLGPSGRLAGAWIDSKLTPLLISGSLLLGLFSVWKLPREEEPQIVVPMVDVFVQMPGAAPREVEQRVTKPLEKLLWEIPGVEYVYSTSSPGYSLLIVRFLVGQNEAEAVSRLTQKLNANLDRIPPGATPPLVKPRSIDDVPILALTFWSKRYGDFELRRMAAEAAEAVKQAPDVSAIALAGGRRRELRVTLDPAKLAAYGIPALQVERALGGANATMPAGELTSGNRQIVIEAGQFLSSARDAADVVVGASNHRPVFVRDIATVTDGGEEPSEYVRHREHGRSYPAVTLSVSKRKGSNAVTVADDVLHRIERFKGSLIPSDVEISITRHYGETAREKSNELLEHMLIAVVSVSVLIALTLGIRESLIVFTAIPVTLALTLTVFYLYGYTLNRITLFALIFSIGILVDDAIVVVENIVRHWRMPSNQGRPPFDVAIEAVDEVGNPTILATLAVIGAILPMAFVGGLMGPYMRPIPIGATAAMVFSLLVAFLVTPWAAVRILKQDGSGHGEDHGKEDRFTRAYRHIMNALLQDCVKRTAFLGIVIFLLAGSCSLFYFGAVKVKMLPFDNKSEFQIIIDMPNGTPLEQTEQAAQAIAQEAEKQPEAVHVQTYAGTASPYNFNGLVRHYYLRRGPNVADIQVNLLPKGERKLQSHEIAKQVRDRIAAVSAQFGARVKVAEVPPGPPVLQTLVAEVYGPDLNRRIALARRVRELFRRTNGVVDADWYVEDPQPKILYEVDQEKAALHGISQDEVSRTLQLASAGRQAGLLHAPADIEDVPLMLRMDRAARSDPGALLSLRAGSVPLSELVRARGTAAEPSIYHKNLMPVTYVTADVAGAMESPVYAILALMPGLAQIPIPEGYAFEQHMAAAPSDGSRYSMKWDGEWHVTYEVFRDLGIAFAAVLILIYGLVVGWFQSFSTPLVIMAAIPFSLVGILPAHGILGAFFTATSMIGFIAGAGIVVRNSIILVDFIELRLAEGMPLDEAVVDAGAVRFRPMVLTAAAVVAGSSVILFDPIFQGLAVALMAGEIASLLLSRMTVPVLYYLVSRRQRRAAAAL
ncbi:MAG TPA: efflux RND transporter permease subunit [Bryobacteraceae bacterium]|nr:efflux RND transporter permease subunit [Bryobacteraceae bacterium]